jgi:uncharacterized PurR-regulated membrane protein YhhQ (DUF165 family)
MLFVGMICFPTFFTFLQIVTETTGQMMLHTRFRDENAVTTITGNITFKFTFLITGTIETFQFAPMCARGVVTFVAYSAVVVAVHETCHFCDHREMIL